MLGVFFFLPVLAALAISLTDFDLYALADLDNLRFVGLRNYCAAAAEPLFWKALGNTFYFVAARRAAVHRRLAGRGAAGQFEAGALRNFFRTVFFAPVVTTLVAVAVVWRYIFHTRYGFINYALEPARRRPDRLAGRSPLGDAGDHHPRGLEELRLQHDHPARGAAEHSGRSVRGARIDGASRVAAVPACTLPGLAPVLMLVSILTMAGYFQLFAEPYVMTQGGPLQSTMSVLYFMYEEGFKWWSLGRASAVAFLLFVLMFAVTLLSCGCGRQVAA